MAEVIVYSKPDCCLCDQVKQQLRRLEIENQFSLREIDILEDAKAFDRFKDQVPVVYINGRKVFKYQLDEKKFLEILARED